MFDSDVCSLLVRIENSRRTRMRSSSVRCLLVRFSFAQKFYGLLYFSLSLCVFSSLSRLCLNFRRDAAALNCHYIYIFNPPVEYKCDVFFAYKKSPTENLILCHCGVDKRILVFFFFLNTSRYPRISFLDLMKRCVFADKIFFTHSVRVWKRK